MAKPPPEEVTTDHVRELLALEGSTEERSARWRKLLSAHLRHRFAMIYRCHGDARKQVMAKRMLANGEDGLIYFCRWLVWTFDPRVRGKRKQVLLPWPKQEELLRAVYRAEATGEPLLVEKSRDTGATWLLAAYLVWRWLFSEGWVGSVGSRKGPLLDSIGDAKSFFWKLRYILKCVPPWMLPEGYNPKRHSHYARIVNPATDAQLVGEAGPDMGRGGRSSLYVLDEFGAMPRARDVRAAVSANTDCIVYISTATGSDTELYQMRHAGQVKAFRLHWTDDPRKGAEYREKFLSKFGPIICARELDIDYSSSEEATFIPLQWIDACVDYLTPEDTAGMPRAGGLDLADQGVDDTASYVREGPRVHATRTWQGKNPTRSVTDLIPWWVTMDILHLAYDATGVGAGSGGTLEHAQAQRELAGLPGLPFTWQGVHAASSPTSTLYDDDGQLVPAHRRFANLKAELWWQIRLRAQRTFENLHEGASHPVDTCLSIPSDLRLKRELTAPRLVITTSGLIAVESKKVLKARGIKSTDYADAMVLSFVNAVIGAHGARVAAGSVEEGSAGRVALRDGDSGYGDGMDLPFLP